MILYDKDPQTLARIILCPRSVLAHLFSAPESPIIGFRTASRCNLGVTEMLQFEERPKPMQEVGRVLAFL
jgi:hypothetical protein